MLKFFTTPDYLLASKKLQEAFINSDYICPPHYKIIQTFVRIHLKKNNKIDPYLKAMKKQLSSNPKRILKFLLFLHCHLQNSEEINSDKIIQFLKHTLQECCKLIESYAKNEEKKERNNKQNSEQTRATSKSYTKRFEEEVFCSQYLLLSNIIKPFINYLLKIASIYSEYKDFTKKDVFVELTSSEVWIIINLFNLIGSFVGNFNLIGRYFKEKYGKEIILLAECISEDISECYSKISKYVTKQTHILKMQSSFGLFSEEKGSTPACTAKISIFMNLLNEISFLNEKFYQIYLGKYFYQHLSHLRQPSWVHCNCETFDFIYKSQENTTAPKCDSIQKIHCQKMNYENERSRNKKLKGM